MIKSTSYAENEARPFYGALLMAGGQDTFYVKRRLLKMPVKRGRPNVIEYMVSCIRSQIRKRLRQMYC